MGGPHVDFKSVPPPFSRRCPRCSLQAGSTCSTATRDDMLHSRLSSSSISPWTPWAAYRTKQDRGQTLAFRQGTALALTCFRYRPCNSADYPQHRHEALHKGRAHSNLPLSSPSPRSMNVHVSAVGRLGSRGRCRLTGWVDQPWASPVER